MPKLIANRMKWKAELLTITDGKDENDRPKRTYVVKRPIFYEEIGTTAQEKYLSMQSKTEITKRIKVNWDKSITEKNNAIRINSIEYNIIRIFTDMTKRVMELSLSYVD